MRGPGPIRPPPGERGSLHLSDAAGRAAQGDTRFKYSCRSVNAVLCWPSLAGNGAACRAFAGARPHAAAGTTDPLPRSGEGRSRQQRIELGGGGAFLSLPHLTAMWLCYCRVLCVGELYLHGGEVLGEVFWVAGAGDR